MSNPFSRIMLSNFPRSRKIFCSSFVIIQKIGIEGNPNATHLEKGTARSLPLWEDWGKILLLIEDSGAIQKDSSRRNGSSRFPTQNYL
jgi:hypothetical protein